MSTKPERDIESGGSPVPVAGFALDPLSRSYTNQSPRNVTFQLSNVTAKVRIDQPSGHLLDRVRATLIELWSVVPVGASRPGRWGPCA
jgi:hypothetical protein